MFLNACPRRRRLKCQPSHPRLGPKPNAPPPAGPTETLPVVSFYATHWRSSPNGYGETNVPSGLSNVVSVAAGSTHSLALRNDGTVVAWGAIYPYYSGPIIVPPQATNVAALALGPGAQHALVLKSDGTVLDWLTEGSLILTNIPALARNIVAVASGSDYGLALRSDGKVVTWGSFINGGVTPVPASATNIVAIAASWHSTAALRSDGTVLVWGPVSPPQSSFTNFVDLACFGYSGDVLALRRNGTMVEYSSNVPKYPTNTITAIAAGGYTIFAVVGNGPSVFPGIAVNRTVTSGSQAYFRAVAVGTMPINYQWLCNGTNVPGATNTVLVLTNVQPVLAGNYYSLTASNALGLATNGAMFLGEVPLEFSIQPQALSVSAGATAKFSVTNVIGVGSFTYQWQFNNANIDGATNSSLSLTNVQLNQAGTYSLVVGNSYGNATNNATLVVQPFAFTLSSTTNLMFTTHGMQLSLGGVFATNSVIFYASTDLISWLPILTNPPATGSVLFLDSAATNLPQRFYRAAEQ
jgi:Immunoglobulin I-set domain/Regulator of chromosome condensation (RCC1) repeat